MRLTSGVMEAKNAWGNRKFHFPAVTRNPGKDIGNFCPQSGTFFRIVLLGEMSP